MTSAPPRTYPLRPPRPTVPGLEASVSEIQNFLIRYFTRKLDLSFEEGLEYARKLIVAGGGGLYKLSEQRLYDIYGSSGKSLFYELQYSKYGRVCSCHLVCFQCTYYFRLLVTVYMVERVVPAHPARDEAFWSSG